MRPFGSVRVRRGWLDNVQLDAPEESRAAVDPRGLDVVVANLVGNALRHGAQPVAVRVRGDGESVMIEAGNVQDGGASFVVRLPVGGTTEEEP